MHSRLTPDPLVISWRGRQLRVRHDDPRIKPYSPVGQRISGMTARLVRVLRQIAQVHHRLEELTALEAAIRDDPLWRLYEVVVAARADGHDRLAELEADIRSRIASAQARLAALSLVSPQLQGDAW